MAIEHIRLSELTGRIGEAIRARMSGVHFWVMADVSSHNYKADKKVHHFDLVEKDPVSGNLVAKLAAKSWGDGSRAIETFERITGQRFSGNISVLLKLEVQYHDLYGIQANLVDIDANFTLGALEQQRRQTLADLVLKNEGVIKLQDGRYVTRNNQLSLSPVIQQIAVISSKNSAGAEDLRHTLQNNAHNYTFNIDEYHSPVQGEHYAVELVQQLINVFESGKKYDAVVITRGGGAQTDFLIFDHYSIARAVARFPVPIITGIGHQKNESITDLMAHTSTKTPTKAAEFIIAHNRRFEEQVLSFRNMIIIRTQQRFSKLTEVLSNTKAGIVNRSTQSIAIKKDVIHAINRSFTKNVNNALFASKSLLLKLTGVLLSKPGTMIGTQTNNLLNIRQNIGTFNSQYLKNQKGYLHHYERVVALMSPLNILRKGFAIVKSGGTICAEPASLRKGDNIEIVMASSQLTAEITGKKDQHATTTDL